MSKDIYKFIVSEINPGHERLDYFLVDNTNMTRSAVQKAIKSGYVVLKRANQNQHVKSKTLVEVGDEVLINFPSIETTELSPEILYEDSDVLVINKPYGILAHDKSSGYKEELSLVDLLADNGITRESVVHRLDRTTSGVMILAKNSTAADKLKQEFKNREVNKVYIALCEGVYNKSVPLVIDAPINRSGNHTGRFVVDENGREAKTIISKFINDEENKLCLVSVAPLTGRTHQIRVHLKHAGHTIVGDKLYGSKIDNILMLHAYSLKIKLPMGELREFSVNPPKEFVNAITKLSNNQLKLDVWLRGS